MELLEKIFPALVVALFMFVINRQQTKRDKRKEADEQFVKVGKKPPSSY